MVSAPTVTLVEPSCVVFVLYWQGQHPRGVLDRAVFHLGPVPATPAGERFRPTAGVLAALPPLAGSLCPRRSAPPRLAPPLGAFDPDAAGQGFKEPPRPIIWAAFTQPRHSDAHLRYNAHLRPRPGFLQKFPIRWLSRPARRCLCQQLTSALPSRIGLVRHRFNGCPRAPAGDGEAGKTVIAASPVRRCAKSRRRPRQVRRQRRGKTRGAAHLPRKGLFRMRPRRRGRSRPRPDGLRPAAQGVRG